MGFFSGLFGGSQRRDIERGRTSATGHVNSGFERAREAGTQHLDRAMTFLQPMIESGDRSRTLYDNAIGVNGAGAQREFTSSFQSDPGFRATLEAGNKNLTTLAASKGYGMSGRAQKELFDYGQRHQGAAYEKRLDRLAQGAQAGGQTRLSGANLINQTGQAMMGSHQSQAGALANIDLQSAAARANTRFSIGDLANLIGSVGKAAAAAATAGQS